MAQTLNGFLRGLALGVHDAKDAQIACAVANHHDGAPRRFEIGHREPELVGHRRGACFEQARLADLHDGAIDAALNAFAGNALDRFGEGNGRIAKTSGAVAHDRAGERMVAAAFDRHRDGEQFLFGDAEERLHIG